MIRLGLAILWCIASNTVAAPGTYSGNFSDEEILQSVDGNVFWLVVVLYAAGVVIALAFKKLNVLGMQDADTVQILGMAAIYGIAVFMLGQLVLASIAFWPLSIIIVGFVLYQRRKR